MSKGPSGRRFLVGFGYVAGNSVAEKGRSEVETGERLLDMAKRDWRA